QMASSDAIEGSLSEQPHVYNFMAGGGLVPGETYLFQDEGVLPIADMVVARQNRLHVVQDADEPGKYDAHWIVELDKDAVRDALAAAVEQMVAGVPEMRGKGVDSLAGDIEVITRVDYHIDAATGVVERL